MFKAGVLLLVAQGLCVPGQALKRTPTINVDQRIQTQNAVFTEYYDWWRNAHPELATMVGDYSVNDRLADYSLAGAQRQHQQADQFLKRLRAIPTTGMPAQDRTSHDLLVYTLAQADESYALKNYEMPVNQMDSPAVAFADLPLSTPFETVQDYEDYLARLRQIPRALRETSEVLLAGQHDGLMPPKYLLQKVPAQCEGVIHDNPYLLPTKSYPATISLKDQERLTRQINRVVTDQVIPAYHRFADFIAQEYAPHGRSAVAVESLPNGKKRYALAVRQGTSTSLTAAQIHEIGLQQVTQITDEMTALAATQGHKDLSSWRAAIAADPKWRPTSAEQIVEDYRGYIKGMEARLPQLFGPIPATPIQVERSPTSRPEAPRITSVDRPMALAPDGWW